MKISKCEHLYTSYLNFQMETYPLHKTRAILDNTYLSDIVIFLPIFQTKINTENH